MKGSEILLEGIQNWKLRLVLSALLCIMGLAALISMILGEFLELTVWDKSIVSIAIFMVGTPAYLILSNLGKVDQYTIAGFLNESLEAVQGDAEVLVKREEELDEDEKTRREQLEAFFTENPLYNYLPDKPVKQAYALFVLSLVGSFGIWFIG
ncbi:hypothetical protein [Gracilimonas sp.]|uniref:hypothetical protein n=1 Tax=Gracilimonas sp. TaxID=1974203 RepID=UPI002871269F|nr:hypothetical protein [Gracilimonas sp.]